MAEVKRNFIKLADKGNSRIDLEQVVTYSFSISNNGYDHTIKISYLNSAKDIIYYYYDFSKKELIEKDIDELDEFLLGKPEKESKILP